MVDKVRMYVCMIQDGRLLTIVTKLPCHMSPSLRVAALKGDIFGRTIYPASLTVIAFKLAKLWGGGGGRNSPPNSPAPEDWIGLVLIYTRARKGGRSLTKHESSYTHQDHDWQITGQYSNTF